MERNPVQSAGMRLAGMKRMGTPEQILHAERELAAAYLERHVQKAIDVGVDPSTLRRLGERLLSGGAE